MVAPKNPCSVWYSIVVQYYILNSFTSTVGWRYPLGQSTKQPMLLCWVEAWCAVLLFRGCSEQAHVSGKQHPIEGYGYLWWDTSGLIPTKLVVRNTRLVPLVLTSTRYVERAAQVTWLLDRKRSVRTPCKVSTTILLMIPLHSSGYATYSNWGLSWTYLLVYYVGSCS